MANKDLLSPLHIFLIPVVSVVSVVSAEVVVVTVSSVIVVLVSRPEVHLHVDALPGARVARAVAAVAPGGGTSVQPGVSADTVRE